LFVSLAIIAMVVAGSSSARTVEADAMAPPMAGIALQGCQFDVSGGGPELPCDVGLDTGSKMVSCPMLGVCITMGSGMSTCAPNVLMEFTEIQRTILSVVAVRYRRSGVEATGLPAEPLFQPPIL